MVYVKILWDRSYVDYVRHGGSKHDKFDFETREEAQKFIDKAQPLYHPWKRLYSVDEE